jgi:hypothetical protein
MASMILTGDTSGAITLSAPLVAGSNTVTLPAATGTISLLTQATSVATTSGTSFDFTGIPSWAKRITVMFNGVSTNGASVVQVQLGSGTFTTSGYLGSIQYSAAASANLTTGFKTEDSAGAAYIRNGIIVLTNLNTTTWSGAINTGLSNQVAAYIGGGSVVISGTLDRIRITTVNGTDTFDAGSINVMWEG